VEDPARGAGQARPRLARARREGPGRGLLRRPRDRGGRGSRDGIPRADSTFEKLARLKPAFDREAGTITAGNASPLTDGAAALWVATDAGLARLPAGKPRAAPRGLGGHRG